MKITPSKISVRDSLGAINCLVEPSTWELDLCNADHQIFNVLT
jgi:hypothetical protein